jgi:tRNA-uridine 2-sulfurtransferase
MEKEKKKKVYVGMSGGVDSSVSAYLLKNAGYDVTGVFIKVWQPEGIECTWKEDRLDAMRVAAELDIPFKTLDLEAQYKKEVIDYMIAEYAAGRTPNPDVACNKYVKFDGFLKWALQEGADYIATGHYTQNIYNHETRLFELRASLDTEKDQGYFLWTLGQKQLKHVLFPVGAMEKKEVRSVAEEAGLYTATKKDSQGLCFIGKLDIKDFLKDHITIKQGNVLDNNGRVIGHHNGVFFLTIGERHGFVIDAKTSSDKPVYIIAKDIDKNTVTVSSDLADLCKKDLVINLKNTNWVAESPVVDTIYESRIRYRGSIMKSAVTVTGDTEAVVNITEGDASGSAGQSLVIYKGDVLMGGGIIK